MHSIWMTLIVFKYIQSTCTYSLMHVHTHGIAERIHAGSLSIWLQFVQSCVMWGWVDSLSDLWTCEEPSDVIFLGPIIRWCYLSLPIHLQKARERVYGVSKLNKTCTAQKDSRYYRQSLRENVSYSCVYLAMLYVLAVKQKLKVIPTKVYMSWRFSLLSMYLQATGINPPMQVYTLKRAQSGTCSPWYWRRFTRRVGRTLPVSTLTSQLDEWLYFSSLSAIATMFVSSPSHQSIVERGGRVLVVANDERTCYQLREVCLLTCTMLHWYILLYSCVLWS